MGGVSAERSETSPDLALVNANVITIDPARPKCRAVAVSGDRLTAVGSDDEVRRAVGRDTRVVDCQGLTLLPGFIDAHCHLLGLARSLRDLDCGPLVASSISALQGLVRSRAEATKPGGWVRGHGYDDLSLAEGRHPNRWDLDRAAPDHPVWLDHRSGHASVLNSAAMRLAGIHRETVDPPHGIIHRDPTTGEPSGLLFETTEFLRERLGNLRSDTDFEEGVRLAARLLLSYGVTSVQDAGVNNGPERWRTFAGLQGSGALPLQVTMFAGSGRLEDFLNMGEPNTRSHRLRLGHLKVMLTATTGALTPTSEELDELVSRAHRAGFPVAIHAVEEEAVAAAATALAKARYARPVTAGGLPSDRIEHCAECPPNLVKAVRRSGAAVVTQPGFVYWNGPQYRTRVPETLQPHLYPAGALMRAGVPVAFGSDAPVIDPNPWPAIYSAATRLAHDGRPLKGDASVDQSVPIEEALRMHTLAAAATEGAASEKGSITPGKLADLVLVDADPTVVAPELLKDIKPVLTIVGGKVVWGEPFASRCWM